MIAGIDYSTRAVDVVLLDEETDAATWHRFELEGKDAFDRTRAIRDLFAGAPLSFRDKWEAVLAVGIENPGGKVGTGAMYRVQGAILTKIPRGTLVQPFPPASWRKTVGLPGNASKDAVAEWATWKGGLGAKAVFWPQDACDAYCIALATRTLLERVPA
jgi:hypothetical protein